MTTLAARAYDLADRVRRMQPMRHDPHWVHLEKCDIERELAELALDLAEIEGGVPRETIAQRKDAEA